MKTSPRLARLLLATCATLLAGSVLAADIAYPQLINKSGRQRMLSQRIAKAYLQMGANVQPEQGRQLLSESVKLFDQQLAELKQANLPSDVQNAVKREEQQWASFRELATGPVNQATASKLINQSDALLGAANDVTMALQDSWGQTTGRAVNLAGRQRMLSQRLSKYYLAKQWNVAPADSDKAMQEARSEFVRNQRQLSAQPELNAQLRQQLELAQTQWVFLDTALQQPRSTSNAQNVASSSERILEVLDDVVSRIEKNRP
ncbi:type IV pili methyl-accepting chemotaxis transducer N-terminal domain-containing protein [Chitinivorax sp. PXF-14]|uniref:type IV pili methyl-accepting chemotaxis transducer N-terminal domain-containing protein n=1 Tax=Chitinivorax sp. PXF-14 TaxID=3230488 RepID=UPI0034670CBE